MPLYMLWSSFKYTHIYIESFPGDSDGEETARNAMWETQV